MPPYHPFRRLVPIGPLLLAVLVLGVTGFMTIEHWTLLEAAYMVTSDFLDTVSCGGELEFLLHKIQVSGQSSLVDKTLAESQIRTRCVAVVLAIH